MCSTTIVITVEDVEFEATAYYHLDPEDGTCEHVYNLEIDGVAIPSFQKMLKNSDWWQRRMCELVDTALEWDRMQAKQEWEERNA